jgi:two-component system alkaline phosphatase synthesis response regulator PhoP
MNKPGNGLIYVVDDEPNIRRLASLALQEYGFATQEFSDGTELLKAVDKRIPHAIVLDWVMPQPDGLTVCGRIKLNKDTKKIPILILTARTEEVDCVLGLEMGADDYITKPFSLKELCARVNAVIRRNEDSQTVESDEILKCGDIVLNLGRRTVIKGNTMINLTMKEFDLLSLLMAAKGRVLDRQHLMEKIWSADYSGDARTVDVHIRYLRQKIENEAEKPYYVRTVRGVGYRFVSEDEFAPCVA